MCGRAACSLAPATLLACTGATEWRQGSTSSSTKAPKAESDAPSCKSEPDTKAKNIKHEGDGLYAPALNLSQGSFVPVLSLESSPPARVITSMRWGLVGAGSEHPDAVHLRRPFNARSETVATKRCFKRLLLRRRCAVLAEAYYEFQKLSPKQQQQQQAEDAEVVAAATTKVRQPYLFAPPDFAPTSNSSELDAKPAPLLYLAALYDVWTNAPKASKRGGREALQPHDSLATVTVLTIKAPTDDIRAVHNRMPLLLDAADGSLDFWLDCSRFSADAALTTVTQACVSRLTTTTDTGAAPLRWFPVSPLANDPHCNDAAACLVPLDRKLAAITMTNTAPVEGLASEPPRAPKRKRDSEADGTDAPSPCALAAPANDDDGSPHAKRAKHTHDTNDLPAEAAPAEVHFFDLPWSPASTQSSDDEADSDFDDYGYCSPCSSCQPSQESQEDADAPA